MSDSAIEMQQYLTEIVNAHSWTTHLVIQELAEHIVDAESIRELIKIIHDVEYDLISDFAVQALIVVGTNLVIDTLIEALKGAEPQQIIGIAKVLGTLGDRRAVEPLLTILQHTDGDVRAWSALALGEIGDPVAIQPILQQLTDEHYHARQEAADALTLLADESALQPMLNAFYKIDLYHDEFFHLFIVRALGRIPSATHVLLDMLKNIRGRDDIREEAMMSLGKIGDKVAFEPLVAALTEYEYAQATNRHELAAIESYKMAAIEGLGNLRDIRAVDILIPLLSDTSTLVRGIAAQSLGLLKDKRSLPYLRTVAQTDHAVWATGIRISDFALKAIGLIEEGL